jgi:deoxyadenosine/deoxycytidine kinase
MPPFRILFDGGIGVGKTTLMKALIAKLGVASAAFEPVASWIDHIYVDKKTNMYRQVNFLGNYYDDRKHFAFPFQVFATANLYDHDRQVLKTAERDQTEVVLFERSIWSTNIFSGKAVLDDCLTPVNYEILQILLQSLTQPPSPALTNFDLIFYLRTQPAEAFRRIQARDRTEELSISLDYVAAIIEQYDAWFAQVPSLTPNTANHGIIPLDSSRPVEQLVQQVLDQYTLMKETVAKQHAQ